MKAAARGVVPDAVIDRPKGYFPVPALTHLQGPVLELVTDALRSSPSAACSAARPSTRCSRAPNEDRTNLDGSSLWQLGLLELWLQRHVGPSRRDPKSASPLEAATRNSAKRVP